MTVVHVLRPQDTPFKVGIAQLDNQLFPLSNCHNAKLEEDDFDPGAWQCGNCLKTVWFPLDMTPCTQPVLVLDDQHSWKTEDIMWFVKTWTGLEKTEYLLSLTVGTACFVY